MLILTDLAPPAVSAAGKIAAVKMEERRPWLTSLA
jgi:hypothetical protein